MCEGIHQTTFTFYLFQFSVLHSLGPIRVIVDTHSPENLPNRKMPDFNDSYQCTWPWQASSLVSASDIVPTLFPPNPISHSPQKKCVVSSIIVLIGLIFLASRYILKYQLYKAASQLSQLDMAERQEADRRELLLHHNEEDEAIRQVAQTHADARRCKLEAREAADQAKHVLCCKCDSGLCAPIWECLHIQSFI